MFVVAEDMIVVGLGCDPREAWLDCPLECPSWETRGGVSPPLTAGEINHASRQSISCGCETDEYCQE